MDPNELKAPGTAVILNSRQSKYPIGSDQWIRATGAAAIYIKDQRRTLITSLGMNTWEISLFFAARLEIPAIIVTARPARMDKFMAEIRSRFHLREDLSGFVFITGCRNKSRREWWAERDRIIVDMADNLLPVSIRPGGFLERELKKYPAKIVPDFRIPYERIERPRPKYDNLEIDTATDLSGYLLHFTRSSSHPWPGESDFDFYARMIESDGCFCNNASKVLESILSEDMIRGSTRNIRGGYKVVGFTGAFEEQKDHLFRYRPRLVNPYFEPFGIAVEKEAAVAVGVRPVYYGKPEEFSKLSNNEKPWFQCVGRDQSAWNKEAEWRHWGDFNLNSIPRKALKIVVYTDEERVRFSQMTEIEVVSLERISQKCG